MKTLRMFVSMNTTGILKAKAQIDAAVALPIPGNVARTSGSCGSIPSNSSTTRRAHFCREIARRLYPIPCQTARTSGNGAPASDGKVRECGNEYRVFYRHPLHLRLLEHDLGDEDPVGIRCFSPCEVPPVIAIIVQDNLLEFLYRRGVLQVRDIRVLRIFVLAGGSSSWR